MEKELLKILKQRLEDTLLQMFCEINREAMFDVIPIRRQDAFFQKIINESLSYIIFEMDVEEAIVETILQLEKDVC